MSEIVKLLKAGESETVEFKPSLSQTDKVIESISAFSNANGGTIVIGVSDKGSEQILVKERLKICRTG